MEIAAATNNSGKAREFAEILKDLGISVLTMRDLGIDIDV